MATCSKCIHFADCLIDKRTRYLNYNSDIACANVEELCKFFKDKANFVEVVRCKDCEYCETLNHDFTTSYFCEVLKRPAVVEPNDFCSYGERRTDNER